MIEEIHEFPGVEEAGLVNNHPPLIYAAGSRVNIFKEETKDRTPSNIASMPYRFHVSPGYFEAAGTGLLAGTAFTWHDCKNAPALGVVNEEGVGNLVESGRDWICR